MNKYLIIILSLLIGFNSYSQRKYMKPKFSQNWSKPSKHPDHIVLNFSKDPATSISITWRTNREVSEGVAEIAISHANPKFTSQAISKKAITNTLRSSNVVSYWNYKNPNESLYSNINQNYHSVTFEGLNPNTIYAYRVGDGSIWSEWIQFKTASKSNEPFSFLYVGDAQNYVLELWSRLIREGYKKDPNASFIIHAGDLVNDPHNEDQWHEWFKAGGWIHRSLPSIPVPGNHEYGPLYQDDLADRVKKLSIQWNDQFTLPDNGIKGILETNYYIDYQGVRFVALNSNEMIKKQSEWLEDVLKNNPNKWTIAVFHHPVFSASRGRDNKIIREYWKPLFDKYNVDLALQGHDHSYTRGKVAPYEQNNLSGQNSIGLTGTVYVVSVSGGKMYQLKSNWDDYEASRDKVGSQKQLFQVISIDGNKLKYKSYTALGELFDEFELVKNDNGSNSINQ